MEENKKKKIIIMIVGVLALLVIVSGATLAFFSATDAEEERQITTAKEELDIKIKGSTHVSNIKPTNDFILVDDMIIPVYSTNKENSDVAEILINVTNNSKIGINYNLYVSLEGLKLNNTLTGGTSEDIKWALYKLPSEDGYSEIQEPVMFGDFYDPEREQKMMYEVQINPEDTHYYLLYIYIEENGGEQNKLQNISFDVKVRGDTKPLDIVGRKLTDVILENNVIKDREPNYKLSSFGLAYYFEQGVTNLDKGLFRVQNEDKSKNIYYFRGVLFDSSGYEINSGSGNYVGFGIKDTQTGVPIFWRILRINEDGSIVLVAQKNIGIEYNWETDSGKPDYEGSNIQEVLNEWFDSTFSEKEKEMVKEATYCNDRSDNYTAVSKRLNKENPEPTIECKEEKDKITSKVGLLTADETVMAGGYTQDYLQSNNLDFMGNKYNKPFIYYIDSLTMSPASENRVFYKSDYELETTQNYAGYLYPVITLNPDVKISKGVTVRNKFYPSRLGLNNYAYYIGFD